MIPATVRKAAGYLPAVRPELVEEFLAGRCEETRRAYHRSLEDFRGFLGVETIDSAARALLSHGLGEANRIAIGYRAHLQERGLSAATVNARLAAVRSLVDFGNTIGLIPWKLKVRGLKAEPYRDTAGPGHRGVLRMLEALENREGPKAARDRAIVALAFKNGLRRGEIASLDLEHLDLGSSALWVLGKGRSGREKVEVAPGTLEALRGWLEHRGTDPGPLFFELSPRGRGKRRRISGSGIYHVIRTLGREVGIETRPHGLRHAGITAALDLGADIRSVREFSRHKSLGILSRYDDNRQGLQGKVARLLDAASSAAAPARGEP